MNLDLNGMHLHIIQDLKFKTFVICLKMTNLLELDTAYLRNMISLLLVTSTQKYKDETTLSRASDAMYGAEFVSDVSTIGNLSEFHFSLEAINPNFVDDQHYFENLLDFFNEVIFHPAIHEQSFDLTSFERNLENYQCLFDNYYDNYSGYGTSHLYELMAPDKPLGCLAFGKEEQLDQLDPTILANYYLEMLKKDRKDLYVVGNISDKMIELIKNKIHFDENEHHYPIAAKYESLRLEPQLIYENKDLNQTFINIGLTTSTIYLDEDHIANVMINHLLGHSSNSLLFSIIREQHSLCYYISSNYDPFYGVITITVNNDPQNTQRIIDLIKECIVKIQEGDFSEELMNTVKKTVIDASKANNDTLYGIINNKFKKDLCGYSNDYSEIDRFKHITKEQIMKAAKKLKIDTIYVLGG